MVGRSVCAVALTCLMFDASIVSVTSAQAVAVGDAPAIPARTVAVTINMNNASLEAVLRDIAKQAGLIAAYGDEVTTAPRRVTLHVRNVSAMDAFEQALSGTNLKATIVAGNVLFEKGSGGARVVVQGGIRGRIIDAKTKQPLHGATVTLDDATKGVTSDDAGTFRIANVMPGSHVIRVRLLGYTKTKAPVTVVEGQTASVDVALELSVNALDQVVVTGTVASTALRAVPNAMTVITAKDIEQRGITHIDQLFRGDVPGLFAQNQGANPNGLLDQVIMFSRGTTTLNTNDLQTKQFTAFSNPIKTYVDGVELADPQYLSQIDPKSVDRIEIITGPQASTIYGSNAINGVMQIFTKRGTTAHPQLTLNLQSGWVENNFSSARTPQHDYSAQLSGVEGRLSYNAGGSWDYIGPWTPAKQTTRTGAFGGTRLEIPTKLGRVTADVTLRRSNTQNVQRGNTSQPVDDYRATGWYLNGSGRGLSIPTTSSLEGQTLGLTLGWTPVNWWSHELGVGQDASDTERRYTARGYLSTSDTTLRLEQNHEDRRSLRYTTTARVPVTSLAQATITVGADAWEDLTSSLTASPQTLTGSLAGSTTLSRQPNHNTGGFLQTQLGIKDQLFFTYGLRAEWNPGFGQEVEPSYAPRYGVAYTWNMGSVTAKLRGSYGRSTRPPPPTFVAGVRISQSDAISGVTGATYVSAFGDFYYYLPNAELGPEYQQGGEGGLELYLGSQASLVITRYNQTVDGLIAGSGGVDSVRSLVPNPVLNGLSCALWASSGNTQVCSSQDADGFGYFSQLQYVNLGSIRNQGWELQGSVNMGPVTTRGTYSWTKSRTIGVNPKYASYFPPNLYPQYQLGATFQYLPEHTWAVGVTYAHAQTTLALNVTGTGRVTNAGDDFYMRNLFTNVRLQQNRFNMGSGRGYYSFNSGYAMADLNASRRLSSHLEGVLQVQNITNRYTNDSYAGYAVMGRQVKLGARLRP